MSEDAFKNKKALAACSGMSPYGLVSRVAVADTVKESDNVISICMGATAADREGFRGLIKKYPIVAVNGCDGACVNKILKQKGVEPVKTLDAINILNEAGLKPTDVCRLDDEGERSVEKVKKSIKKALKELD